MGDVVSPEPLTDTTGHLSRSVRRPPGTAFGRQGRTVSTVERMERREPAQENHHEVVVVGAGQAGLAVGHHLRQRGVHFLIAEAGDAVGHSWAGRWDSLRLFTPARYSGLPGTPFPGDRDSYPGKDHVAEYLADYAHRHDLPVRLDTRVRRISRVAGGYVLETGAAELHAQQVVVATGPFQVPSIPAIAHDLDPALVHVHSSDYHRPDELPVGQILVVGGGNSGYQIAAELAETRTVDLAIGRRNASVPQQVLGRDIFWWQSVTGLIKVKADSPLGRRMQQGDGTVIGLTPKGLRQQGVHFRPRVVGARGRSVEFADGSHLEVDGIVWATGFRQDHSWIDVPEALAGDGRLMQHRGVTPAPGLYVLGLPWQHTTGSALLGFVKADAAFLADQVISGRGRPAGGGAGAQH